MDLGALVYRSDNYREEYLYMDLSVYLWEMQSLFKFGVIRLSEGKYNITIFSEHDDFITSVTLDPIFSYHPNISPSSFYQELYYKFAKEIRKEEIYQKEEILRIFARACNTLAKHTKMPG